MIMRSASDRGFLMLRPARFAWRRALAVWRRLLSSEILLGSGFHMRVVRRVWDWRGRPVPPPHEVKRLLVREVARDCRCRVLVETGTHEGYMLLANHRHFARLVSIELEDELWRRASVRLSGLHNVTVLHGDSSTVLPPVIQSLREPTVFWLDAHYSAGGTAHGVYETPIVEEIRTILASQDALAGSVVLIDDARCFGEGDYPTIDQLAALISPRPIEVADDVLRFEI